MHRLPIRMTVMTKMPFFQAYSFIMFLWVMLEYNVKSKVGWLAQQNQMSVLVKGKDINYTQSTYYRANPYAQQGYIPSKALVNRKQPDFPSEIPQGVQYFQPSAKKHFTDIAVRSSISQEQLLSNPEKYPRENTLANDINYLRNLSTIDIEGANANSKKSMGVKYRIKAQEELMRRNAKIITPILYNGNSEQEMRRKIALEQVQRINSRESTVKSGQRVYNSEKKLPPPEFYHRNHYLQRKDEGIQFNLDYELEQALLDRKLGKNQELRPSSNDSDLIPKTIEIKDNYQYGMENSDLASNVSLQSKPFLPSDRVNPQAKMVFQKQKNSIQKDLIKKQQQRHRSQVRLINPTNLSYEGSIVRNSGILAGLGKNLAIN